LTLDVAAVRKAVLAPVDEVGMDTDTLLVATTRRTVVLGAPTAGFAATAAPDDGAIGWVGSADAVEEIKAAGRTTQVEGGVDAGDEDEDEVDDEAAGAWTEAGTEAGAEASAVVITLIRLISLPSWNCLHICCNPYIRSTSTWIRTGSCTRRKRNVVTGHFPHAHT
jgi:hypothetical protein